MNVVPKPPPEPDPSWWDDPELRPDLARQDVAALYRFLQRRGWSQNQIGQATGQSQPEVSAILKGRRVTSYEVLVRVADGFAMPRGYLGLSGCVACPAIVEPAVDRPVRSMREVTIRCIVVSSSAPSPRWPSAGA